jgi:BirA family biotin operon repressor/biotin-[acetyl-CoA-carboxylase] ligase
MSTSLTFPILKLLADGKFHSGEAIAKYLNVSRATVWNALQEAQKLNIEIFSVHGRGYKLPHTFTWLSEEEILAEIHANNLNPIFALEVHDHLASTNSYLMQTLPKNLQTPRCVIVNLQTQGRGRRGRTWASQLGGSLTFSLLWRFQGGAASLSGLSLAVGVALTRTLHQFGLTETQLKWPNDIVVKKGEQVQKLAGILIELQGDMEGPTNAVIGVGVNLHLHEAIKAEIDQPVTDIKSLQQDINPNQFLAHFLHHAAQIFAQFEQQGFAALRDEWNSLHAYHQQPVKMLHPNGSETLGTVFNVEEDGVLLVQTLAGLTRFSSGEISLRSNA